MKIAIIRLSAMGDIIQSMIVLQFIKRHYPNSSIDWFVDSQFAELLVGCNDINNIIKLNIREIKQNKSFKLFYELTKKLRNLEKYDKVIDLQGLFKSAIVSRLIPSYSRVGFDINSTREKIASFFYSNKFHSPYHENVINRYLGLVGFSLQFKVTKKDILNKKPFFNYSQDKTQRKKLNICIILGASFKSKIYPTEKFAEIVKSIDANFLAIWHTADEFKMANKLQFMASKVVVKECATYNDLKTQFIQADIVIGGDTGPTHLAWALNKPSVIIFGSTPFERNCFITKQNLAVDSGENIDPYNIDKDSKLIDKIQPKEVINKIKELI